MRSIAGSIMALTLVYAGCAGTPDPHWDGGAPLHGVVYSGSGVPLAWVEVKADDGPAAYSDVHGRFTLPDVRPGVKVVTAHKDGYEPVEARVPFTDRTQVLTLRLHSASELGAAALDALVRGSPLKALELVEIGLEIQPGNGELRFLAAIATEQLGRADEAAHRLEWFAPDPPQAVLMLRDRLAAEAR